MLKVSASKILPFPAMISLSVKDWSLVSIWSKIKWFSHEQKYKRHVSVPTLHNPYSILSKMYAILLKCGKIHWIEKM